jgi:hypothetical protein
LNLHRATPAALSCDEARALHEATTTGLSLGLWRERHGSYPSSLAELVPQYLPRLPVDHSSGLPLRYKLVNGKPLLYGASKDADDDGGVWLEDPLRWPRLPDRGDWVLYPPIDQPAFRSTRDSASD